MSAEEDGMAEALEVEPKTEAPVPEPEPEPEPEKQDDGGAAEAAASGDGSAGAPLPPPPPGVLPPQIPPMAMGAPMGYPGYGYGGFPGFPPAPMMPYPYPMPGMPGMPGMEAPAAADAEKSQSCVVHPPGLPRPFEVPFPERKLPVCDRCKKNYRSRELCRQRDGHRALPWQTTFVVVTISDDVLEKVEDGTYRYLDVPVIAELQQIPEMCRGPADGYMLKEPICKVCKEKNYTRDHCRNTLKHTTPPYQCVYVKLVRKEDDLHRAVRPPKKKRKKKAEDNVDGIPTPDADAPADDVDLSDDLSIIHPSKTFFASISSKKITVKWCEAIRYPLGPDPAAPQSSAPPGFPPSMPPFMGMPGGQYQMWDAFRAGAVWAQQQAAAGGPPAGGGMPWGVPPAAAPGAAKSEFV